MVANRDHKWTQRTKGVLKLPLHGRLNCGSLHNQYYNYKKIIRFMAKSSFVRYDSAAMHYMQRLTR